MLTHAQIWRAIDALAARHGLSPSGLARAAGLDPTTFNKSKRGDAGSKLRWPSTESISKMLASTGASLEDFVALVDERDTPAGPLLPLRAMAEAGRDDCFDAAGCPTGPSWERIAFPGEALAYVLEIGDDFLLPVYREGDRLLVSPSGSPRRGDRVVMRSRAGEMLAGQLNRLTAQRIELKSFAPASEDRGFALGDIAFVHRIIWASQ